MLQNCNNKMRTPPPPPPLEVVCDVKCVKDTGFGKNTLSSKHGKDFLFSLPVISMTWQPETTVTFDTGTRCTQFLP